MSSDEGLRALKAISCDGWRVAFLSTPDYIFPRENLAATWILRMDEMLRRRAARSWTLSEWMRDQRGAEP